jgi:hypothetical protein
LTLFDVGMHSKLKTPHDLTYLYAGYIGLCARVIDQETANLFIKPGESKAKCIPIIQIYITDHFPGVVAGILIESV